MTTLNSLSTVRSASVLLRIPEGELGTAAEIDAYIEGLLKGSTGQDSFYLSAKFGVHGNAIEFVGCASLPIEDGSDHEHHVFVGYSYLPGNPIAYPLKTILSFCAEEHRFLVAIRGIEEGFDIDPKEIALSLVQGSGRKLIDSVNAAANRELIRSPLRHLMLYAEALSEMKQSNEAQAERERLKEALRSLLDRSEPPEGELN